MEAHVGDIVVPGETVVFDNPSHNKKQKITLGPGLRRIADSVLVCKSGVLKCKPTATLASKSLPSTYWVNSHQKRYVPVRSELVVGVVANKAGDFFKLDIGSSEHATLSCFAFEGATKKNRPNINVGDVLAATVLDASKDMEPEVVCVDSHGKKGPNGPLSTDGFLFTCSLNLIRKIKHPDCPLVKILGRMPYEICMGMNGRVWLKSPSIHTTIAIANMILDSEQKSLDEITVMCNEMLKYQ